MALEIGGVGESIQQGPTRLMDMEILNGQAYSLVEDDVGEVWKFVEGEWRTIDIICTH